MTIEELNALSDAAMQAALAAVYEHSPWVAARTVGHRPFADIAALHTAMAGVVAQASGAERMALVLAHPDLAGKLARAGRLESASAGEQAGLGLDCLSDAEFDRFDALNRQYRARFGFPFVIAVKRHTRATVLAAFETRLTHEPAVELRTALAEIDAIAGFRLHTLLGC